MLLAIFTDIHGNPLAMDAVLAGIQNRGEADGYWVLGISLLLATIQSPRLKH